MAVIQVTFEIEDEGLTEDQYMRMVNAVWDIGGWDIDYEVVGD